jgi:glutathione reductase (NADPH)
VEGYDALVIGTGVSGQVVAADAAAAGLKVACVDRIPYGGTCALRGCEPKKVLYGASEAVDAIRRLVGRGPAGTVSVSWPELQAFRRTFTDPVPARVEGWMREAGIEVLHGTASFVSPGHVAIDGESVETHSIVVAAGARPRPLGFEGEALVCTSADFLYLAELPQRIVFVGGGYISFELAHIASAAGADVTILHRGNDPLAGFDADLADALVDAYRLAGIRVVLGAPVTAAYRDGAGLAVEAGGERYSCDLAVHGAGRVPDLGALDLAAGDVAAGPHGVEVDEHLRSTTSRSVYACGDAASRGAPLTPVGIRQGAIVARNLVREGSATWDDPLTPSVVFSGPPLAGVGLTEAAARAAGLDIEVHSFDTSGWFTSRRVGVRRSAAKTIVERGTGRILGAHLLSDNAEEVVNVYALAISRGVTARELQEMPLTYPTITSDIDYLF